VTRNRGVDSGLTDSRSLPVFRNVEEVSTYGTDVTIQDPRDVQLTRVNVYGNFTLRLPPATNKGQAFEVEFCQASAAGMFNVTFDPSVKVDWPMGVTPVIMHKSGSVCRIRFECNTTLNNSWSGLPNFDTQGIILSYSLGDGVALVQTNVQRFRTFSAGIEILGVSATADFAAGPSGGNAVIDLGLSTPFSSIWPTNPGNRPTILNGAFETSGETLPDTVFIAGGSSIRIQCVSANGAGGLVCNMRYRYQN
jgi:hypothetical protein